MQATGWDYDQLLALPHGYYDRLVVTLAERARQQSKR